MHQLDIWVPDSYEINRLDCNVENPNTRPVEEMDKQNNHVYDWCILRINIMKYPPSMESRMARIYLL